MNKARFTNLALEVAREMRCEFPADEWDNSGEEHSEESYTFYKSELIEFATKFLARVREEEGKEAVAWRMETGYEQPQYFYQSDKPYRTCGNPTPLFLHPQEKELAVIKADAAKYQRLVQITERGCYQLMYWDTDRDSWHKVSLIEAAKGEGK